MHIVPTIGHLGSWGEATALVALVSGSLHLPFAGWTMPRVYPTSREPRHKKLAKDKGLHFTSRGAKARKKSCTVSGIVSDGFHESSLKHTPRL